MPKMSPECCLRLEKSPLPVLTLRQLYLPYFDKQCVVFEKITFFSYLRNVENYRSIVFVTNDVIRFDEYNDHI